jgi:hypothetical protein
LPAPPGGDGGQAELAHVRFQQPKPMAAVTDRDLNVAECICYAAGRVSASLRELRIVIQ